MYSPTSNTDQQPTLDESEKIHDSPPRRYERVKGIHGWILVDVKKAREAMRHAMRVQAEIRAKNLEEN